MDVWPYFNFIRPCCLVGIGTRISFTYQWKPLALSWTRNDFSIVNETVWLKMPLWHFSLSGRALKTSKRFHHQSRITHETKIGPKIKWNPTSLIWKPSPAASLAHEKSVLIALYWKTFGESSGQCTIYLVRRRCRILFVLWTEVQYETRKTKYNDLGTS